jgi:hypothetical protein
MLISNPCEFLQTASQDGLDSDIAALIQRGVNRLFRSGALIAEIE